MLHGVSAPVRDVEIREQPAEIGEGPAGRRRRRAAQPGLPRRIMSVERYLRLRGGPRPRQQNDEHDGGSAACAGEGIALPLARHPRLWPERAQLAVAIFRQKASRLSSTPNRVLNTVESAIRMSPARSPPAGSQTQALNSRFPAAVKGCGLERSMGCLANTLTAFFSPADVSA